MSRVPRVGRQLIFKIEDLKKKKMGSRCLFDLFERCFQADNLIVSCYPPMERDVPAGYPSSPGWLAKAYTTRRLR
jgi:hypothetical protein